jgi:hypothetical protein
MEALAVAWMLCLPPSPDPYDPAALVAYAEERRREGDTESADIILARATRLAPHHPRVVRARDASIPPATPQPVAPQPAPATVSIPAPPPIWPAR